MTDEYFYIEEVTQNLSDTNNPKRKQKVKIQENDNNCQPLSPKKSQEIRLHEIEQQLEMAESRCNTLKGQVDYMKMLYNGMNNQETNAPTSRPSIAPSFKRESINSMKRKKAWNSGETKPINSKPEDVPSRDVVNIKGQTISSLSTIPHRDICTRDATEATKSINNIISGITNSVNRLTQLQINMGQNDTQITSDSMGIRNIEFLPRVITEPEKPYNESATNTVNKTKSKPKRILKKDVPRGSKILDTSLASVDNAKKGRLLSRNGEKKLKVTLPNANPQFKKKMGKIKANASRTLLSKKSFNFLSSINKATSSKIVKSPYFKPDKLVELYHNSNVKIHTASDESISAINKRINTTFALKNVFEKKQDKPETIYEKIEETSNITQYRNMPLPPIEETENNNYGGGAYYKNYELPTIASKMKQVARTYFENFNFRTIPFVAARSISPSHNLGVNIQQVLSIIKGRKPVSGISPTLAYNIELAATKLGSKPLSCLVSTLGSRMQSRTCPLSRHFNNISTLQELAKEIPEETIEELNNESSNTERLTAPPFASGDKATEKKTWNAFDVAKTEKCTCVPKESVGFQEVYNKCVTEKFANTPRFPITKKLRNKPWNANNKYNRGTHIIGNIESKTTTMTRKEKSLKEILKNLYDEFSCLNQRYEELKNKVNQGTTASNDILQEIENMETILQNKEDEITMVMSLYKEVLTLKQQVNVLKKRASQSTVVVNPFMSRQRDYKEMNAAGHLTKLLRHIQQFQGTLKTKTT